MTKNWIWAVTLLTTLLTVNAFHVPSSVPLSRSSLSTQLCAAKGMGMASPPKTKGGMGKKTNGMGKKNGTSGASTAFDVNASMIRLEKRYDELMSAATKQMAKECNDDQEGSVEVISSGTEKITSEYIVAARSNGKSGGVKDWIPFAQICLARPESEYDNANDVIQAAVSTYCRELSHMAAFGAPVFSTVARSELQYSVEPIDSFHKHVYESVIEGVKEQDMTKAKAREILGLEPNESDKATIKQAYRKLSFELHPDRVDGSEEEQATAADRFGEVKLAYEIILSGVRQEGVSWYESLGGRARTGFLGPINLLPLALAQEQMTIRNAEGAIVGLDKELIQTFVARNLRSS